MVDIINNGEGDNYNYTGYGPEESLQEPPVDQDDILFDIEDESADDNSDVLPPDEKSTGLEKRDWGTEIQNGGSGGHTNIWEGLYESAKADLLAPVRESVEADMQRVEELHNNSIGELKKRGELTQEIISCVEGLKANNINADVFTPEQATRVYEYAMAESKEIMDKKPEVGFAKGCRLFRITNGQINPEAYMRSRYAYEGMKLRLPDETPDFGDYDLAKDADRRDIREDIRWLFRMRGRLDAEQSRLEGRGIDTRPDVHEKYEKDAFSMSIGRIARQYREDQRYGTTLTDDNTDIMPGKDLDFASGYEYYPEEYEEDDEPEDESSLLYGIFTEKDIDKISSRIDVRNIDDLRSASTLHTERLKEALIPKNIGNTIGNVFEQLDVDFVEEVSVENRPTVKTAIALAMATLEKASKIKFSDAPRVHLMAREVRNCCASLLNIKPESVNELRHDQVLEVFAQKYEKRSSGDWDRVNRARKNLVRIDNLFQYVGELSLLLDIKFGNSNRSLIDNESEQQ